MWKAIVLGSSILKVSHALTSHVPTAGRHWSTLSFQWSRHIGSSSSALHCELTKDATDDVACSKSAIERMRLDAEREMEQVQRLYGSAEHTRSMTQAPPTLLTSRQHVQDFLRDVDTVLFDCDGVLYRSPDPAPGAANCLTSLLAHHQKQVVFVTNNAGTNRRQLCDKLNSILQLHQAGPDGNPLLREDMMISSSYSAARYLQNQKRQQQQQRMAPTDSSETVLEPLGHVHVIGSPGLCEELREAGFVVTTSSGGPSEQEVEPASMTREELASYDFENRHPHPIDAVVVGHDTSFTFRKLCVANVLLQRNPTAKLVATNEDAFDLVGVDGRHIPGNGCVVKALEHSSKRQVVNVGKPSQTLVDLIASETGLDPPRSVIVGDRLDTDIQFGMVAGMRSLLVLTGVTTAETLRQLGDGTHEEPLPTHIMPHVGLLG